MSALVVTLTGVKGDADLYVRAGEQPSEAKVCCNGAGFMAGPVRRLLTMPRRRQRCGLCPVSRPVGSRATYEVDGNRWGMRNERLGVVMRCWLASVGISAVFSCADDQATRQPGAASGASGKSGSSQATHEEGFELPDGSAGTEEAFSFFMTSFAALQRLSNNENGFGGDLRYGEADGLSGADKICSEIAESSLAGTGARPWRAFLSVTKGPDGEPVHAIDRIGAGPWYDRLGRLFAASRGDALGIRPKGDAAIANDFPNEDGVPNHAPDGVSQVDNHDVLTGTDDQGQLFDSDWKYTCQDWTSSNGSDGTPRVGHSWPRSGTSLRGSTGTMAGGFGAAGFGGRMPRGEAGAAGRTGRSSRSGAAGGGAFGFPGGGAVSGDNWMSALTEAGCAAGASLVEMGGPRRNNPTVGSGGGYGAIYCFVVTR